MLRVKAAIGKKDDILAQLFGSHPDELQMRFYDENKDGLTGIDCRGASWIFPLLKPSRSPTAAPEFFTVLVKRMLPNQLDYLRTILSTKADWVFFPLDTFPGSLHHPCARVRGASPDHPELDGYHFIQWGRAHEVLPDPTRHNADVEMSEWDVVMGKNMFVFEFYKKAYADRIREEAQRGVVIDGAHLTIHLRPRQARGNNIRRLEYAAVTQAEVRRSEATGRPMAEELWKVLPFWATKPGAYRHKLNIARRAVGARPFARGEWPPAPAAAVNGGSQS